MIFTFIGVYLIGFMSWYFTIEQEFRLSYNEPPIMAYLRATFWPICIVLLVLCFFAHKIK